MVWGGAGGTAALAVTPGHPAPGLGQEETSTGRGAYRRAGRGTLPDSWVGTGPVMTLTPAQIGGLGWPGARSCKGQGWGDRGIACPGKQLLSNHR